jgi:hypothetical protein
VGGGFRGLWGRRRAQIEDRRTPRRRTRRRGRRRMRRRRVWGKTMRGWGDKSTSGSASTRRFRSSHLVHPPIMPHDDNRVVIIPCVNG